MTRKEKARYFNLLLKTEEEMFRVAKNLTTDNTKSKDRLNTTQVHLLMLTERVKTLRYVLSTLSNT